MIQETLVTTVNAQQIVHIAPMGVHVDKDWYVIMPFKPALTLTNLLETKTAVLNYADDVRIFAGCLTGRRDWPLQPANQVIGYYLTDALAHTELILERIEDDPLRPRLYCKAVHTVNHKPFQGFNRAQFSVLEAAILVSRLGRISNSKIRQELEYLRIGLEKTAGDRELQAWAWLMERVDAQIGRGEL